MDSSIWVPAIVSLAATVVGGGLSITASIVTQRQQAKSTRQLAVTQRSESLADRAIQELYALKEHVQLRPHRITMWSEWEAGLKNRTGTLRTTIIRLRDRELRERLTKTMELLDLSELMTQGVWGGSPLLPRQLCDHAIECLGAFVRNEPLPPAAEAFETAKRVELAWLENAAEQAMELEAENVGRVRAPRNE
ncbi:hypothetical protein [Kitasatospora sp. NPDC056731]|uniref:hypothetical protein n=1 Tax=Kitasatospora sp. NPDC056731 TaxID=3155422 RepID=UPI0034127768